jgi:hypothetical protein
MQDDTEAFPTYPAVRALLARAGAWIVGPPLALLVAMLWLAWRTGWVEVAVAAPFVAWALHFVMRVVLDVVTLVADTLMPR